jgi:hypothetical protein
MRAVVRFMMIAAFARCLVAGLAMAIVLRRWPAAGRTVVVVVLLLAAADARLAAVRPVRDFTVPAAWRRGYDWLAGTLPGTPIVEIPYGGWADDANAMVYSLSHRRPIMNGYSAVVPNFSDTVSQLPEDVAWRALREAGVQYVLAHPSRLLEHPLTAPQLRRIRWRRDLVVAEIDDTLVLAVPPARDAQAPRRTDARDGGAF